MRIVSAPRKGLCQLKLFDNCILDALEDNYSEIAQNTFAANSFNLWVKETRTAQESEQNAKKVKDYSNCMNLFNC